MIGLLHQDNSYSSSSNAFIPENERNKYLLEKIWTQHFQQQYSLFICKSSNEKFLSQINVKESETYFQTKGIKIIGQTHKVNNRYNSHAQQMETRTPICVLTHAENFQVFK